jgi:hypothetical protein
MENAHQPEIGRWRGQMGTRTLADFSVPITNLRAFGDLRNASSKKPEIEGTPAERHGIQRRRTRS